MKLTIDNQEIEIKGKNLTLLDAAIKNDIYIPHLCAHPELSPYGGCRLCIVEIEGMKGYPTACTTKIQEGMKIRSKTHMIQEMRKEIIQLILSEHPTGCLICNEAEECKEAMPTIRKVGATTGCRWCPKDTDCELQRVVEYLGISEIKFPVYYQNLEVEKYDPFYDRDYNLCIYCGRCVRICEEHRKSYVLGLNERGKDAKIGPAFHLTHLEAECEFCGACVSVCPTGALSEKNRKWFGVPDQYIDTFCPLCSINCDIQTAVKDDKIIGTLPTGNPHESGGELCVKGRFTISELVNHPDRIMEPQFLYPEGYGFISWEQALDKAVHQLKQTNGERMAFFLSPNLSLEEIVAINHLADNQLKSKTITTSVLNENLAHLMKISEKSIPLKEVENSGAVVTLFLKGNYSYGPLTLAIKRAAQKGIPLCQIGWTRDTLTRFSEQTISPPPGKEKQFFKGLLNSLEKGTGGNAQIKQLKQLIEDSPSTTFVLAPEICDLSEGKEILSIIANIAELTASHIYTPNPYGNIQGLLSMGEIILFEDAQQVIKDGKVDLIYIIGDSPFKKRPSVDFVIHQSSFPADEQLAADLILPTSLWGEFPGTYINTFGEQKSFKAVVKPPESVKSNQEIISEITKSLGGSPKKTSLREITQLIPNDFSLKIPKIKHRSRKKKVMTPNASYPYLLIQEKTPHAFHNLSLSQTIAGMKEILPEDTLIINPADAFKLGFKDQDIVWVESQENREKYPLKMQQIIKPGFIFLLSHNKTHIFNINPCPVHLRRANV